MNINYYNYVYKCVDNDLQEKCTHKPNCVRGVPEKPDTPLVVVQEVNNPHTFTTTRLEETASLYQYEFNIFTKTRNKHNQDIDIAREISACIDNTMRRLGCRRIFCRPTPNLDRSIYRIIMRYEKIAADNRGIF